MVWMAHEAAGAADSATMVSFDSARALERLRRELASLREARDCAESLSRRLPIDPQTHQNRLQRAERLVRLRTLAEERLVDANRHRDTAVATMRAALVAAEGIRRQSAQLLSDSRAEAVRIIDAARSVAVEMEVAARADATKMRCDAGEELATLRAAAVREVAEARRLRMDSQRLKDDAELRWQAANEAMHSCEERSRNVDSGSDTIWLTGQDSMEELDDRFEKYLELELHEDSARAWILDGR